MNSNRSGSRVLTWIVTTLELVSSLVLVAMMVLTLVDVIGRYFFGEPIFGATEIISMMLAIVIFSGLGIANARDDHISVELIDQHIRRLSPRVYDAAIKLLSVIVMGIIAYVLFSQALENHHQNARTVVLEMPLSIVTMSIGLLSVISLVSLIIGMLPDGKASADNT